MGTSVVHRLTVIDAADFDTAFAALIAALPAKGSNFAVATIKAAEADAICIGSRDRGDDADIDSEAVGVKPIHEGVTVRPAGSLTAQRYITRHAGIEEVTFTAYDVEQEVFNLDSNVEDDDEESQRTSTQVNRAILIERDGFVLEGYPNVVLHITDETGGFGPGDDAVSKLSFTARVLGTDDIPSGQVKMYYEAAGT